MYVHLHTCASSILEVKLTEVVKYITFVVIFRVFTRHSQPEDECSNRVVHLFFEENSSRLFVSYIDGKLGKIEPVLTSRRSKMLSHDGTCHGHGHGHGHGVFILATKPKGK